jgi:hypothetical protein
MNLARYNQNRPDAAPNLFLEAPASRRRVPVFGFRLAGETSDFALKLRPDRPALPGTALRFWTASRRLRTTAVLAVIGAFLAIGRPAAAQTTNATAATNAANYSSFQIIVERNIFDPNRYAHTSHSRKRAISKSAPNFSLVGTMNYRNGMIAFFDGNDPDYRKVLSPDGVIAGYKVVEITQRGVKLEAAGKPVEMKVGAQMRQEGKDGWQLAGSGELPVATVTNEAPATDETPAASPAPSSAGEPNDVLKKLMQQREQELK